MNIRGTSIQTFNQIREEGLLSLMRFQCYELVVNYGPMTANQLMQKARELNPNRSHQAIESIGRRLSELVTLGVVAELGTVECPITKRMVILWGSTDQLPNSEGLKKRKSVSERLGELEEEVKTLKQSIDRKSA